MRKKSKLYSQSFNAKYCESELINRAKWIIRQPKLSYKIILERISKWLIYNTTLFGTQMSPRGLKSRWHGNKALIFRKFSEIFSKSTGIRVPKLSTKLMYLKFRNDWCIQWPSARFPKRYWGALKIRQILRKNIWSIFGHFFWKNKEDTL